MKKILICCCVIIVTLCLIECTTKSQATQEDTEEAVKTERTRRSDSATMPMIAGSHNGLFSVNSSGRSTSLWTGGSVKKIIPLNTEKDSYLMLGSEGVLYSEDLKNWEPRNKGLPEKTIKIYKDGKKSFSQIIQDLKDLEYNPANPQILVTATKDRVYLSRDMGQNWTALPLLGFAANGIKAAASAYFGNDLTVFASHSIYGILYIQPDKPNAKWIELITGLEKQETTNYPDEASDIAVIPAGSISNKTEVFVSQTFRRRLYKLDWDRKVFNLIWKDDSPFGTIDSLNYTVPVIKTTGTDTIDDIKTSSISAKDNLYFLHEGTIASLNISNNEIKKQTEIINSINKIKLLKPNSVIINDKDKKIALHELWLLNEPEPGQPIPKTTNKAANKEGLFLPVHHILNPEKMEYYYNLFENGGINMVVIDMKDEFGRIRYNPKDPDVKRLGTVVMPIDIEPFVKDMKKRGVWVVARIVVFKDKELYAKENGRYAVWDSRNNKPWMGTGFSEHWLDPYSEEVWEYVAKISEEIHERGIDEIQYDYIRFPTDGSNLGDIQYRWRDPGMDMESTLYSFLRHVRSRVKAPISVDIYGANGWYRTGARTGQEVELIAPLVDVICPMYYPSHFEQYLLAQHPAELRPWRIYYYGTLRNDRIARGQVVIRPWAQAFFINVSYDRQYYGKNYVRRQVEGVREAGNGGFTFWNMGGDYDDIPLR